MTQAVPVSKGPMSVAKVPLTLQSLSGKEEEQHQAPQNLASHAVRTTRGEPAQTRDCHHRLCGHQQLYRRQPQQQAKTIRIGFEELAQESAQLRMRRTIREPLARMSRKLSDGQIL